MVLLSCKKKKKKKKKKKRKKMRRKKRVMYMVSILLDFVCKHEKDDYTPLPSFRSFVLEFDIK
jgi:hypothetical protein